MSTLLIIIFYAVFRWYIKYCEDHAHLLPMSKEDQKDLAEWRERWKGYRA